MSVMYVVISIRPGIHGVIILSGKTKTNIGIVSDILGYCSVCARPFVYSRGEEGEGCELSN